MSVNLFARPAPSTEELRELIILYQGHHADAERKARALTLRFSVHPLAWSILAAIYRDQKRNEDALVCLRRLIQLVPGDANSHFNMANTLRDLGLHSDAIEPYRTALKLKPELPHGFFHLGNMQHEAGLLPAAERSLRKALALDPEHVETMSNLAHVLQDMGRADEALVTYDQALLLDPNNAVLHYNRGDVLAELGQVNDAEQSARTSIALAPDMAMCHAQLGDILQNTGQPQAVVTAYRTALGLAPDNTDIHSSLLFALNYLPISDPAESLSESLEQARAYGKTVATKAQGSRFSWTGNAAATVLRVGLVSADLRNHPVGHFLEGILAHTDRSRVALVGITTQNFQDDLTARIRPYFHEWHSLAGLGDSDAASALNRMGLHVLLDLSGHTAGNRLPVFAYRMAPVQASWLGYFATTGVPEIDYILADATTLPTGFEGNFTETVWRLPETRLCFTPPPDAISINSLPALNNPGITFGSFNNLFKLGDGVIALWSDILHSLASSRLLLQAKQLASEQARAALLARFQKHAIFENQLILQGPMPRAHYLQAYNQVDICLDPFPFPGGTTTAESLWMGVPVLTLQGETFIGRQGAGLLTAAGLPDWIATTPDDYRNRALNLTGDLVALATLRHGLRAQVMDSPLFDAKRFARHFETALWGMWEKRKPG